MFRRNLCNLDRVVRVVVGLTCVYFGFVDPSIIANSVVATFIGVLGVVNVGAAAVSYCPVYQLAGLSTFHKQKN